jgi:hypothetical protein
MDRHRIAICVVRIRRTTGDEADEHYGGSSHPTPHLLALQCGSLRSFPETRKFSSAGVGLRERKPLQRTGTASFG